MNETAENRAGLRGPRRLRHARRRARYLALLVFVLTFPAAALAQFSRPAPPPPTPNESGASDPYGRETPRGSFFSFLQAAERGNFQTAAAYLQIPRSHQASREEIARKLQVVFDHRLVTRSLDLVSRNPQGSPDDGLGPDFEKVEEVRAGSHTIDVILVRVEEAGQTPVWLISWDTSRECLRLYDEIDVADVERHIPKVLVETRLGGLSLWKVAGLLLLLPVFYALSWLLVSGVLALVRLLRRRSMAPGSHWWAASAKSPATFLLTLLVHRGAVERLGIPALYRLFYNRIILVLLCAGLYWLLARLVDALDRSVLGRFVPAGASARHATLTLARRALKLIAFVVVVLIALAAFGVNLTATLAGLGIGGLVLAFAAQKSLENMFGGIAVLSDRALRVGDTCKIGGQQGEVEDITLWATRLRTQERSVVSIPNGVVMGAQIENLSRRDKYWFHPIVGLIYQTTAEQMRVVLDGFRALLAADARVDQANPRVQLLRLGASSLDIEVSAYIRSVTQDDFLAVQEELLLRILGIVEDAGTALAHPTQTVYLAGAEAARPEREQRA